MLGKNAEKHTEGPLKFCKSCIAKAQALCREQCISQQMHNKWHCTSTKKLVDGQKVPLAIKCKLLELVGKELTMHYLEGPMKFCESCVTKVQEIYPELTIKSEIINDECLPLNDFPAEPPVRWQVVDLKLGCEEEKVILTQDSALIEYERYGVENVHQLGATSLLSYDINERHPSTSSTAMAFLPGLTGGRTNAGASIFQVVIFNENNQLTNMVGRALNQT